MQTKLRWGRNSNTKKLENQQKQTEHKFRQTPVARQIQ
jgi:hypothetical protein